MSTSPLVIAATDGSAINNPNGPAGWAWFIDDKRWACGGWPKASNQVAELFAVLALLRAVPSDVPLLIRTDSQFAINVVGADGKRGWMHSWAAKGWVKADGKVPANLSLVQELHRALTRRQAKVELTWVRGHSGDRMNEIADKLCTAASGAIKNGEAAPTGPGWVPLEAGYTPPVVPSPRSAATSHPTGSRPATRATVAAPGPGRGGAKRVVTRSAGRTVSREVLVTSFDEGLSGPTRTVTKPATVMCSACDTPINPLTQECLRCSK